LGVDVGVDVDVEEPAFQSTSDPHPTDQGPISWTDPEPVSLDDLHWPHLDDNEAYHNIEVAPSEDHNRDKFQLIPDDDAIGPELINVNPSSRGRALVEEDDKRYVEDHPMAGTTLPPLLSEQRIDLDGDMEMQISSNAYSPFTSELDWKIAD